MVIRKMHGGGHRDIECSDADCFRRPCWQPEACPVQGHGGVRGSAPRWVCLTKELSGCPSPKPPPVCDGRKKGLSHG